jgi:hypothetical protein
MYNAMWEGSMANNEQHEGAAMFSVTDDELIFEKRRLQAEKGYTDSEASMVLMWRVLAPFIQAAHDQMAVEQKVAAYRRAETEKIQKARNKHLTSHSFALPRIARGRQETTLNCRSSLYKPGGGSVKAF